MRLRARRNLQLHLPLKRWDLDLSAQCRLSERDRNFADDIGVVSRKEFMRKNIDLHVQIARKSAALARFSLAGELKPLARVYAGWDFDCDLRAFFNLPRA